MHRNAIKGDVMMNEQQDTLNSIFHWHCYCSVINSKTRIAQLAPLTPRGPPDVAPSSALVPQTAESDTATLQPVKTEAAVVELEGAGTADTAAPAPAPETKRKRTKY
jgi:hypothetical protein